MQDVFLIDEGILLDNIKLYEKKRVTNRGSFFFCPLLVR